MAVRGKGGRGHPYLSPPLRPIWLGGVAVQQCAGGQNVVTPLFAQPNKPHGDKMQAWRGGAEGVGVGRLLSRPFRDNSL